jgi:hypothetical protein
MMATTAPVAAGEKFDCFQGDRRQRDRCRAEPDAELATAGTRPARATSPKR